MCESQPTGAVAPEETPSPLPNAPTGASPNETRIKRIDRLATRVDACAQMAESLWRAMATTYTCTPLEVESRVSGVSQLMYEILDEVGTDLFDLSGELSVERLNQRIARRLIQDFSFIEAGKWLREGVCPSCGKKELYTQREHPWELTCARFNKCGAKFKVEELYPELVGSVGDGVHTVPQGGEPEKEGERERCPHDDLSCPYHACLGDGCQYDFMLARNHGVAAFGEPWCLSDDADDAIRGGIRAKEGDHE